MARKILSEEETIKMIRETELELFGIGGNMTKRLLRCVKRILKNNIEASSFDTRDTRIWGIDESAKAIAAKAAEIVRAETLKEVGEHIIAQRIENQFLGTIGVISWDVIEALKEGRMPDA